MVSLIQNLKILNDFAATGHIAGSFKRRYKSLPLSFGRQKELLLLDSDMATNSLVSHIISSGCISRECCLLGMPRSHLS
jgi:hypothetical protein